VSHAQRPRMPKPKYRPLWPLLFLPVAGALTGYFVGRLELASPFTSGLHEPVSMGFLGLFGGCLVMVAIASTVLIQRIRRKPFTIGAILITIALIAILLAWAKAMLNGM
jgi:hypothetical protein